MKAIKLHYSEALIRRTITAFWLRSTGWTFFVAFAVLAASFSYLLWIGDRSWWIGVLGAILAFGALMAIALYAVHYRRTITRFRRMAAPEATFELGEERFRVTSDVGSSELNWSSIIEVWRYPNFWLLFISRAQYITIATADLDTDVSEFILAKVRSHGGKVA